MEDLKDRPAAVNSMQKYVLQYKEVAASARALLLLMKHGPDRLEEAKQRLEVALEAARE